MLTCDGKYVMNYIVYLGKGQKLLLWAAVKATIGKIGATIQPTYHTVKWKMAENAIETAHLSFSWMPVSLPHLPPFSACCPSQS